MTREEAKQWLEAMKSSYALPIETYEAIDMAIEALKANNVEHDDIVRISVTDRKKEKVILYDAFGEVEYYPTERLYTHEEAWGMCDLISRADAVQGEWIPIEDKFPNAYKDVIATVWFEDDGDDDDALEIAFGFLNKHGRWNLRLADGSECIKGFYVQAWQPLPTPYKGADMTPKGFVADEWYRNTFGENDGK